MPKSKKVKLSTTVQPWTMDIVKDRAEYEEKTPGEVIDDLAILLFTRKSEEAVLLLSDFCTEEIKKREAFLDDDDALKRASDRTIKQCKQTVYDLGLYLNYFEGMLPWEKIRDKYLKRVDLSEGDYALIPKDATLLFPERLSESHYLYEIFSDYFALGHPESFIYPSKSPLEVTPELTEEIETEIAKQWPAYKTIRSQAMKNQDEVVLKHSEVTWPYIRNEMLELEYDELEECTSEREITDRETSWLIRTSK